MSRIVFRNYNQQAIKDLMIEIGKERMKAALEDAGMERPISMEGFYVEFDVNKNEESLYFRFPSGVVFFLLPVLGYWRIPKKGWEKIRVND